MSDIKVTVRLTEQQHEQLRQNVFSRGRGWSLQKEIVERLFNGLVVGTDEELEAWLKLADAKHASLPEYVQSLMNAMVERNNNG